MTARMSAHIRRQGLYPVTLFLVASLSACMTPKEKRVMQEDIFNVQTRLLALERNVTDTSKEAKSTGENAAKRVASTQAELDRITRELQQMRGDMDALRMGVITGKMPGVETSEGSVAETLARLSERLDAVEESQAELLQALKRAGLKSGSNKKRKSAASVSELQRDFDAKRYKQVSEDAPKILARAEGEDRDQAMYLLAESLFKLGKMREAALKYSDFVDAKPAGKFVPLAKMRLGDCFRHLGDTATARVYYEELIKEFPDSEEAAKVKERLAGGGSSASEKG